MLRLNNQSASEMKIRSLQHFDIPQVAALDCKFPLDFDSDFILGLVASGREAKPVMVAGAWHRAEVHVLIDKSWGTPRERMTVLKELHDAMAVELKARGVSEAVTWFGGEDKSFKRFLQKWGWVKSELTSWHRRIF